MRNIPPKILEYHYICSDSLIPRKPAQLFVAWKSDEMVDVGLGMRLPARVVFGTSCIPNAIATAVGDITMLYTSNDMYLHLSIRPGCLV